MYSFNYCNRHWRLIYETLAEDMAADERVTALARLEHRHTHNVHVHAYKVTQLENFEIIVKLLVQELFVRDHWPHPLLNLDPETVQ